MKWLVRMLRLPVTESQTGILLILCVLTISLMSVALLWQAQIIANQREAIQWLEKLKIGG